MKNITSTAFTLTIGIVIGLLAASTGSRAQTPAAARLNGSFTHVGLIVPNVEKASRDFAEIFGLEPKTPNEFTAMVYPTSFKGDPKAHPKVVTYKVSDTFSVELLEPIGGKSPWRDFLDSTGGVGGLHHVAFAAKGIDRYMTFLQQKGGTIEFGGSSGPTPVQYAYVNMRPKLGVTFELNGPPKE
jgi:catechol 2,3-dioxygenase-like lactoylglutathione lyase family enzyme